MDRRHFLTSTIALSLGCGCISSNNSSSGTDDSPSQNQQTTESMNRSTTMPAQNFQLINVIQSRSNSSEIETTVEIEKQATLDSPAVISISYQYVGETTYEDTQWGEPYPFTQPFDSESQIALVPPRGYTSDPYTNPPEEIEKDRNDWVPEDESSVLLDTNGRSCWRTQDNEFAPAGAPLVDLTPNKYLTQFYWVVSDWDLPNTCASVGQYSHTMENVPPTNKNWTISIELSTEA